VERVAGLSGVVAVKSGDIDTRSAPWAALILRLVIGGLFVAHLYWKFAVLPARMSGWWAGFAHNHYPWVTPYYVLSAEIVGAALIIPGVWARWAAMYALPMMLGAAQFWLVRKGFYFTAAGAEAPLIWAALLVTLALLGDGPYALARSPTPWRWPVRRH
jgi:putative oxidoreductase